MRDYEYADLYFDAHLDKQMRIEVVGAGITIDNSMIELDAFELDEILCSEQELIFGSCEANCVKFTARDMPGSIVGKTIRITETVDGNTDTPFQYGIYKVYSDVPSSDRTKREITAYDAMYDIVNADVKSWYADLPFPMTLRQFRDSFFAYFGITQKETTLVNDGMIVNKTLVVTQTDPDSTITEEPAISGKTIVTAICEINGVFGNINRDGEFEYVELKEIISPLYPANDLYPSDDLFPRDPNTIPMTGHYIKFDYEDFQTKQITQLEIRPSEDSAGATVGTSGNNYVISGNFLVSDKAGTELEVIAANTLSIIRKASYTPLNSSEIVGNPCIELGDPIRFNTTREIIESYVLQRTLTGIQNKRDSIVSPGTETYKQNPNSIRDQIAGVQRRTNKLERTADHTLSELADLDANTTSRFEQTSEQIQTEVSNRQSADSDLSSRITQTADSITTEVANRQSADNEMSSRISQTANEIASEVTARQNADNEMSTKISQKAHSIALTATGGDNSVGITIQLYDEKGNLIDTESGNANITIVGVVKFEDLANAGSTVINGANITTGIIKSSDSEFTRAKFFEGIYYALMYNGTKYEYPLFVVNEPGIVEYGIDNMNTNLHGSFVFKDTASRVYIGNNKVATVNDKVASASNADYATSAGSASSAAAADYASSSGHADYADVADKCGNETSNSHTANCYITSKLTIYKVPSGSARRFKTDIYTVVDQRLDPHRLYDIDVVQFKYKPSFYNLPEGTEMPTVIGMLADDIDRIYPCACEYDEETGEVINWLERYMIPPMLALIQEQHKGIESLKQENLALQNRVSILEQKMEVLENVINNKINQS